MQPAHTQTMMPTTIPPVFHGGVPSKNPDFDSEEMRRREADGLDPAASDKKTRDEQSQAEALRQQHQQAVEARQEELRRERDKKEQEEAEQEAARQKNEAQEAEEEKEAEARNKKDQSEDEPDPEAEKKQKKAKEQQEKEAQQALKKAQQQHYQDMSNMAVDGVALAILAPGALPVVAALLAVKIVMNPETMQALGEAAETAVSGIKEQGLPGLLAMMNSPAAQTDMGAIPDNDQGPEAKAEPKPENYTPMDEDEGQGMRPSGKPVEFSPPEKVGQNPTSNPAPKPQPKHQTPTPGKPL